MTVAKNVLPKEFTARLSWEAYQMVDGCIALTAWEKKLMVEMFGARPEQVYVVPNGVEEVFFQNPGSKITNPKSKYLVCTATITERKRVVELAEAAIAAQVPIWIIGEPYSKQDPYYQKFLSVIRTAGEMVRYEGGISSREKMASIYQEAYGFVLLSSMESLSISALEAAAGGCALLLSDLPWARASFGEGAIYCAMGRKEATSKKLRRFYLSINSTPRAARPCSWVEVGKQIQKIYLELLADKTSR